MAEKVTVQTLHEMKRNRQRIAAAVVYEQQMAQIMDRAGVDLLTVGDSIGRNMWGQETHLDVTLDQIILACLAVTRGAKRAGIFSSTSAPVKPSASGSVLPRSSKWRPM